MQAKQGGLPFVGRISLGVDWLTATGTGDSSRICAAEQFDRVAVRERNEGNFVLPWSSFGYSGWKCGKIRFGTRLDGCIVALSGKLADEEFRNSMSWCTNVSRLDLEATYRVNPEPSVILLRHLKELRAPRTVRGRQFRVTSVRDSAGGFTIYLGARSSSFYGRIYDKWVESGDPFFLGCLRYEMEVKKKLANRLAHGIYQHVVPRDAIDAQLSTFFRNRSCELPAAIPGCHSQVAPISCSLPRSVSDRSRLLAWLRTQVRPTVERLIEQGNADEVYTCLGLPTLN